MYVNVLKNIFTYIHILIYLALYNISMKEIQYYSYFMQVCGQVRWCFQDHMSDTWYLHMGGMTPEPIFLTTSLRQTPQGGS